jgi:hypothetical protein
MWYYIKLYFFILLDIWVFWLLIKLLFQTPLNFLKAFWDAGRMNNRFPGEKQASKDPNGINKVSAVVMAICALAGIENWLFF